MTKNSKHKPLFITLLLTILLVSSAYASLVPIVNAAEPTVQDKTIDVLNDVVGINTEKYAIVSSSQLDNQYLSLPQKEADIRLVSDQGRLRASCSFVNNMLRQIYLSDCEGDLSVEQPAIATVGMAKGFMQRYQNYAGDSFYGELASTLDNVDVSTNITKSARNIKLEVLNWDQTILDYVWTYTDENGIVAKSKNVILSYDRGQLKVFLNNWPLYKVVGTPKISSEEATLIAIEASKNFSYEVEIDNVTSTVTGFNIAPKSLGRYEALSYVNFPNQSLARGGDPFTLYPSWFVPLGFDKSYPGGVTGMTVSIWADTGEISIMGPMVVGFDSSISAEEEPPAISDVEAATAEGFNQESTMLSAPVTAAVIFSIVGVAFLSGKKAKSAGNRKIFWGTLLCGIIFFSVIITSVAASPTIPNSKARVYAALDGGQGSPAQLPQEKDAATWVSAEIASAFVSSGYSTSNHCGSGTTVSNVKTHAGNDQQSYDRVAVFHFGHLAGGNIGYVDNYGYPIWDNDIFPNTGSSKHVFVFIWVCKQAMATGPGQDRPGMPAAWTHRGTLSGWNPPYNPPNLSNDGYLSPDGHGQAYIGFNGISPIISAYHQTFNTTMTGPVKYFIKYFYDYALRNAYSVRDALNRATLDFFGSTFTSSILKTGYFAWYEGPYFAPDYYFGYMNVFGDGAIWLFQPKITLTTNQPISPTFYLDGVPLSVGDVHVWAPQTYTISVSDVPNYSFDHFSYDGMNLGRPATIQLLHNGAFTAYYNWNPTYYTLSISSSGSGHTVPTGNQQCLSYTYAHVQAVPNSGYVLNYWLLDGNNAGSNPTIDVYMNGPHTLQAVFTAAPSYKYVSSIYGYGGAVYYPANLVGSQPDGQFAGLASNGPGTYGAISGTMNAQATGHIYVYGFAAASAGHLQVYVSSNGNNWNYVSAPYVSATSPYWIDCGTYQGTFNYIGVQVQNEWVTIGIDSVKVTA